VCVSSGFHQYRTASLAGFLWAHSESFVDATCRTRCEAFAAITPHNAGTSETRSRP
jgi:hypothetical protein